MASKVRVQKPAAIYLLMNKKISEKFTLAILSWVKKGETLRIFSLAACQIVDTKSTFELILTNFGYNFGFIIVMRTVRCIKIERI